MSATLLPSTTRLSMRDQIASVLQGEIITGKYSPGQRLVERELSERFRVSSIPIREALQVLETQGLVVKQPNRGCSVVDLSTEELAQMNELRALLEPKVAEWAACRMTEAGARKLTEQASRLQRAAAAQDRSAFYAADMEFHRTFWELSGNLYAARILESVVGAVFVSGLRAAVEIDLSMEYAKHDRLLRALVEGRPSDASLLLSSIAGDFRGKLRACERD
ncbi:MAG: GntR family transcriptional regulator [Bryobacterales bacterium]|nr:GntR family transcriptional regulator [Bryobacterales bacterium]